MELTHGLAGVLISLSGLLLIALSGSVPRQVNHLPMVMAQFNPKILTWLARGMGLILFMLGMVTVLNQ